MKVEAVKLRRLSAAFTSPPVPPSLLVCPATVSTPLITLPTVGGATLDITGSGLGLTSSVVAVSYSGGSDGMARRLFTLPRGSCVVVAAGMALRCTSVAGVGANYTFTVDVDGGVSEASAGALSHSPPVIVSLDGAGAASTDTEGGAFVFLRGSNFGPVENTSVVAWASPTANSSYVFPGRNCVVWVPHVAIRCAVSAGFGAALSWRVVVEGQANAMPMSSYAPPALEGAEFAAAGVLHADNQGGTMVLLRGRNLGDDIGVVAVTVTTPAGTARVLGCVYRTLHSALECGLPAGVGAVSLLTVTVLDQEATFVPTGIAYMPPVVTSVFPSTWPTNLAGLTVTLTGRGFGVVSNLVRVVATGAACGGAETVRLLGQAVTPRGDVELSFTFSGAVDHVVPTWSVEVSVAGQGLEGGPLSVPTRPPTVPALSFDRVSNGTHYFLLLAGADFGPVVGPQACAGDVSVTLDGAPCAALTMTQVRQQNAMWTGARVSMGCCADPTGMLACWPRHAFPPPSPLSLFLPLDVLP